MSTQIAMIGAASIVFCKTLMSDILATPALADAEIALMSRTEPKLRRMEAFCNKMVSENVLPDLIAGQVSTSGWPISTAMVSKTS